MEKLETNCTKLMDALQAKSLLTKLGLTTQEIDDVIRDCGSDISEMGGWGKMQEMMTVRRNARADTSYLNLA